LAWDGRETAVYRMVLKHAAGRKRAMARRQHENNGSGANGIRGGIASMVRMR